MPVRPRVLLADDYPGILTALQRLLAADCDVVGSIPDGASVLEATTRLRPDVVLLDVNMPGIGGLEVCRQITQTNPHVKVILFSAAVDKAIRDRGLTVGAIAVIAKHECGSALLPAVQEAFLSQR